MSQRVLSGVQPSGRLHLGNYLGALKHFVPLQQTHDCLYCVVDLHAITVPQDPCQLPAMTRQVVAAFLACGIDPKAHIIFHQSRVAGHSELAWLLACVARVGWLNRMTQFKEKSGKRRDDSSVGLYIYPVLMAADILLYRASHVPVGEDQTQHLELARDIAQKFNTDFATDLFPLPEPLILGAHSRVMSLRDGTKKMSKSDASSMSLIYLTDSADAIATKIRKAKTDTALLPESPAGLADRAEVQNLVGMYAALSDTTPADVLKDYGGAPFARFKPALADLVIAKLTPIGDDMRRLLGDPAHIDAVLEDGAQRARQLAMPTLSRLRELIGLL